MQADVEIRSRPVRVIKDVEVRRGELIDAAQTTFFAKGYDAATVADIIAIAGVSKGGFYHHFTSKEELLDAVIERLTATVIANAADILDDPALNALQKLNAFFARGLAWKVDNVRVMRGMFLMLQRPENEQLYHRMVKAGVRTVGPVLARIVEQGVREKLFDVPDSSIVAQIMLHVADTRYPIAAEAMQLAERGKVKRGAALLETRIRSEETIMERLLGLAAGSIHFLETGQMRAVLEALR
jgi:AcrR family transcriptional regulator